MTVLDESLLLGAPAAASSYQISRSLRFNSADSAYLSRTPASAGNRNTWTWAGWVKRSKLDSRAVMFASHTGGAANYTTFEFYTDYLALFYGGNALGPKTPAVFRDTSAWMHVCVAVDTTQATNTNRVKIYVNGTQQTLSGTYPTQNADLQVNNTTEHNVGMNGGFDYFPGYLADIHFIDGQALTPTSFGQFDSNNVWQPKAYTGTYGTNGFKLNFSDNSAATATTLGKDSSGNSNNWTPNNLSVTAGTGNDSLVDSPTNYGTDTGAGGEVRGNYCTLNAVDAFSTLVLTNGNLDVRHSSNGLGNDGIRAAIAVSTGKWYYEVTPAVSNTLCHVGISTPGENLGPEIGNSSTSYSCYLNNGIKRTSATDTSYGTAFAAGDVMGVAFDMDAGKIWFSKNGTWFASGSPTAGTGEAFSGITGLKAPALSPGDTNVVSCNFGQRPFAYTAPSGYKALCSTNLPTPAILNGATAMDVKLWTGNGTSQTISGLGFSPDLVWVKSRSSTSSYHALYDQIRGVNQRLSTNDTGAENTTASSVTSFDSTGFSLGSYIGVNENSQTFAAWCWDAGSSTVTNTAGTIQSSVRANASAGFSVVTYTGTGSNATVGHGLGVAPSLVIVKNRSVADDWFVQHKSAGVGRLKLNTTDAYTSSTGAFQDTAATSTVFSVGTFPGTNGSGNSMIAYCFAPVSGYSAFGSYTGNGSADGPFVYTGFRPRWVMVKATATASSWLIYDSARDTYNVMGKGLYPDLTSSEADSPPRIDFLSNGFKIRVGGTSEPNYSGAALYCAFAENPFSISRAR